MTIRAPQCYLHPEVEMTPSQFTDHIDGHSEEFLGFACAADCRAKYAVKKCGYFTLENNRVTPILTPEGELAPRCDNFEHTQRMVVVLIEGMPAWACVANDCDHTSRFA